MKYIFFVFVLFTFGLASGQVKSKMRNDSINKKAFEHSSYLYLTGGIDYTRYNAQIDRSYKNHDYTVLQNYTVFKTSSTDIIGDTNYIFNRYFGFSAIKCISKIRFSLNYKYTSGYVNYQVIEHFRNYNEDWAYQVYQDYTYQQLGGRIGYAFCIAKKKKNSFLIFSLGANSTSASVNTLKKELKIYDWNDSTVGNFTFLFEDDIEYHRLSISLSAGVHLDLRTSLASFLFGVEFNPFFLPRFNYPIDTKFLNVSAMMGIGFKI